MNRRLHRSIEAAVDVRENNGGETLGRGLPASIEMVFLGGTKDMHREVLEMLEPRLAPGAMVVADNAYRAVDYLDHVRSSDRYLSADVGGDVEVSVLV